MRDRRGAIWFGSFYTGISYFHPHEALFRVVPIEGGDTTWTIVADVTLDRRGDVWAGTSDKGLYFYDRTRRRGRFFNMGNSGIPSNNVKSIRYDAGRDQLWLGMFTAFRARAMRSMPGLTPEFTGSTCGRAARNAS